MIRVLVVCEGATEVVFTKKVLQPRLAVRRIFVEPRTIPTSSRGRGGDLRRARVIRYLRNTLRQAEGQVRRQDSDVYVTTLFDLYGLGNDFPGYLESLQLEDPIQRAEAIESEFHKVAVEESRTCPDRFFPYIQPYEFESLLFSDVERFPDIETRWKGYVARLLDIRRSASSPEHINDGADTHPSAQLRVLPGYRKVRHGARVIQSIGLETVTSECRHFGEWFNRLEGLGPLKGTGS